MTTIVLAAIVLAVLAFHHVDIRRRDEEARAERAARADESKAWADERRELLNRIKPETSQFSPVADARPATRLPFDDDEAFHKAVGDPLAVSKEDLAELDAMLDMRQLAAGIAVAQGGVEA